MRFVWDEVKIEATTASTEFFFETATLVFDDPTL